MNELECDICKGIQKVTPAKTENPPGLDSISYRVGTYSQFKESMHVAISLEQNLQNLTTRQDADLALGLVDSWAIVADVISFYQERIANEGFLRTATERKSILELARMIGYEINPGVAANTYLAFVMEESKNKQQVSTIDLGTKAQSIPSQGQTPQTFETIEKIQAKPEWNAVRPLLTKRQTITKETESIVFKGTSTLLKSGDVLVQCRSHRGGQEYVINIMTVIKVLAQPSLQRTIVDIVHVSEYNKKIVSLQEGVFALRIKCSLFGHNAPYWNADIFKGTTNWNNTTIYSYSEKLNKENGHVYLDNVYSGILSNDLILLKYGNSFFPFQVSSVGEISLADFAISSKVTELRLVLSSKDLIHRTTEPAIRKMISEFKLDPSSDESTHKTTDPAISKLTAGFKLDISSSKPAHQSPKSNFHKIMSSSRFDISNYESLIFNIREVTVYAQPEILELAEIDITEPIKTNVIELNAPVSDLKKGQLLLITGKKSGVGSSDGTVSEIGVIYDHAKDGRKITLEKNLTNSYDRSTVIINLNVARATNGETRQEVLGSGDSSKPMQTFALKQKPLTYISSPKGSGSESTLEVRVDDVLWHNAPSLLDLEPKDRCYITRLDENGNTSVIFGDGTRGARPNTGIENIKARYRSGIGMSGILKENQITMLMNRPLGVKSVTNPLPTEGAQDPEDSNTGRRNAPMRVLTMGRIVSLQDFEDYANAFAGIGKARSTWGWNGHKKIVCLTVMSTSGQPISQESELYKNLVEAIQNIKDPLISFQVLGFNKTTFNVSTKILVDPDKEFDKIKFEVTKRLLDGFSEGMRQFGQQVALSEIMSVIQNTDGVLAVDVDYLYKTGSSKRLENTLPSQNVRWGYDTVLPSELLTINPDGIEILEMKS